MATSLSSQDKSSFSNIQGITIQPRGAAPSSASIPGIFSLSDERDDRSQDRWLDLIVSDGQSALFRVKVTAKQVSETTRVPSSEDPLHFLRSLLLPPKQQENSSTAGSLDTTFVRRDDDTLRIQISQSLPSGLVRKPWGATLKRDQTCTLQSLALKLLQNQEELGSEVRDMQSNIQSLEQVRDDWKDTAEKLEGSWEKEKSELLENFLKLYSAKQEQAKSLQEKAQHLELELKQKGEQLAAAREAASAGPRSKVVMPACLEQVPDDLDEELFDEETVARLAGTAKKTATNRKRAAPRAVGSGPTEKKARMKSTRALDFDESTESLKGNNAKSSASETKLQPGKKKAASKPKSKRESPPHATDESNSDDDTEFVDTDMKNSILAQLAAMKEAEENV